MVLRHRLVRTGGGIILLLTLLALAAPTLTRWHIPTLVVTANLVVDLLYRWIDPRIKTGY